MCRVWKMASWRWVCSSYCGLRIDFCNCIGARRRYSQQNLFLFAVPVTVGLSTSVAGLLLGTYGFSDLWCWIKSEYKIQRLILHAVPLLLALVTSMVLFVFSFKSIKRLEASFAAKGIQVSRNDKTISRQLITHCFIYNFIYWFTYLPGLIVRWDKWIYNYKITGLYFKHWHWIICCSFRTAQLANEDFNPPFALVLFMSCNLPLQGFWNWFNYKRLKIQKCCCRLETQLEEDFSYSRTPVRSGVSKSVAVDGDVEINDDSTSSNRRVFDWPGDRNETDAGLCSSAIMFEQM